MGSRNRRGFIARMVISLLATSVLAAACTGSTIDEDSTTAPGDGGIAIARPPEPAPLAVGLHRPGPTVDPNAGDAVSIAGFALSEAATARIELWVGDELYEATDLDPGQTQITTGWERTPPEPGLYALMLRATDIQGRSASSFPLWIRARERVLESDLTASVTNQYRALNTLWTGSPGRLLARLADTSSAPQVSANASSCEATITVSPQPEATGIAVYASPFGSTGFVPVALLPPQGGTTNLVLGASPMMIYADSYDDELAVSSAPTIFTPPSPCLDQGWDGLSLHQGILTSNKDVDAAYLYVSYDGGEIWRRAPDTDQTFVYPGPDGGFDFSQLLQPSESGIHYEAWGLVDDQAIPLGTGSYVPPTVPGGGGDVLNGSVPYSGPLVSAADLDWIPKVITGTELLVREGVICTYDPPQNSQSTTTAIPVEGGDTTPSSTTSPVIGILDDYCINAPTGGYSKKFRWRPTVPNLHHGLLQVSAVPPPSGPLLSFPGLVYQSLVPAPAQGAQSIDFDVPLDEIHKPQTNQGSLPDPSSLTFKTISLLGGSSSQGEQAIVVDKPVLPALPPSNTLYVRVVPMLDVSKVSPGVSNLVSVDFDDNAPAGKLANPPQPPSMSLKVDMTPPHLPNPQYQRCVRVISNPFFGTNPAPSTTPKWFTDRGLPVPPPDQFDGWYLGQQKTAFIYENGVKVNKGLIPGATACAWQLSPPDKDIWDYIQDALNFVAFVWDTYVTVFNMLKAKVVAVLAQGSGCVFLAEQLGASHDDAVKGCEIVANTAVSAALIAVGAPPTVPTFAEYVEAAKGDLIDLVVQAGTDLLDCDIAQAACEEVAKKLVTQMIDEIQTQATKAVLGAATTGTNWILRIHPGIYVVPEPAATLSPAIFKLTFTRSADPKAPAPPTTCTYSAQVGGKKANYEWVSYLNKQTTKSGPVEAAHVMVPKTFSVDLSDLKPGQSKTMTVLLDKIVKWYPSGQDPQVATKNVKPSTWIFMAYGDAVLTTYLIGSAACGGATKSFKSDPLATEPWEIAFP